MKLYNVDESGFLNEEVFDDTPNLAENLSGGCLLSRHVKYFVFKSDAIDQFLEEKRIAILRARANFKRAAAQLEEAVTECAVVTSNKNFIKTNPSDVNWRRSLHSFNFQNDH